MSKFLWLFIILFFEILGLNQNNGSVEHKENNINSYLNEISEEQEEKTQIIKYILDKKQGTYIDLGTGGDSISYIIDRVQRELPITLIASDIDQKILDNISKRHPEITDYLEQSDDEKLRLKLIRMDATNMTPIQESSIDGVGASALLHEIYSYVPTKAPLDQFFLELIRVLKKDGIFIYRDPKWDNNPEQDCLLILKDPLAKFFTTLFLPRFLDRIFSNHRDYKNYCIKPSLYESSYIRINFFNKHSNRTKKVRMDEFINIPITNIDFTRNMSIEAPRGLISEIQRHYILFIKNVFITDLVDKNFFDREIINIENLPSEEKTIFKTFLKQKNIRISSTIDTELPIFREILLEKKHFYKLIDNGVWVNILDKEKVNKICQDLYCKGINQNLIFIQEDKLWIDVKIALLLFQGKHSGVYRYIDHSNLPIQVFEWMNREGEEFYFYKTTDEFITYLGRLTKYYLMGSDKEGYILCPLSAASIRTVSRNLYKSVIDSQMTVMDIDGNTQDIIFDKNIIHFKLMKSEEALKIYKEIIKQNELQFPKLTEWVENEWY